MGEPSDILDKIKDYKIANMKIDPKIEYDMYKFMKKMIWVSTDTLRNIKFTPININTIRPLDEYEKYPKDIYGAELYHDSTYAIYLVYKDEVWEIDSFSSIESIDDVYKAIMDTFIK